ncbi:MAG: ribonuclease Z [Candidatus Bathyarchaeia archaeon]
MKIVFLGTSGTMPTVDRGLPAIMVIRKGELILFDCGEGTQQRMIKARLGFGRRTKIFISHIHGDHILGLPGLLETMNLLRRERPLYIYGPKGIRGFLESLFRILGAPEFPLEVFEITDGGVIFSDSEYKVEAVRADHEGESWSFALIEHPRPGRFHPEKAKNLGIPKGPIWKRLQQGRCVVLGDRLIKPGDVVDPPRPGRKMVYSGDTRPNKALVELSIGADVLIHEATFDDDMIERAQRDGHSTVTQAADMAASAKVDRLFLTHISSRYPSTESMLEKARKVYSMTFIAEDFMEIEIPLKD